MKTQNLALALLVSATLAACSSYETRAAAPAMVSAGMLTGANGMTLYTFDKDAAGNVTTTTETVVVDTLAPNQPHIASITDNSGSTSDHTTNDTTPTLAITAEAGATIRLQHWDGTWIDSTQYSVSESTPGNYSLTMTQAGIADKSYKLFAEDAAGKSDRAVGPCAAKRNRHRLALQEQQGRKHQQEDADRQLEDVGVGAGD